MQVSIQKRDGEHSTLWIGLQHERQHLYSALTAIRLLLSLRQRGTYISLSHLRLFGRLTRRTTSAWYASRHPFRQACQSWPAMRAPSSLQAISKIATSILETHDLDVPAYLNQDVPALPPQGGASWQTRSSWPSGHGPFMSKG